MLNVAIKIVLAILVIGWSIGLLTTGSSADAASGFRPASGNTSR
jgi:hypothetical protein